MSIIAETARLETATEILAEYIGYINSEIDVEEEKNEDSNTGRLEALRYELNRVIDERRAITPDNIQLINRALYIYGPLLKTMHG